MVEGASGWNEPPRLSKVPEILPAYLIHWNAPEWCGSAARSMLASQGVDVSLTVVDNGQLGGRPLVDCLPPGVEVIRMERNAGYSGGANAALDDWHRRFPESGYCVVGSHDHHVAPDALARLLLVAEQRPDCGILGPGLLGPKRAAGGRWRSGRAELLPLDEATELVECDWASGTCLFLRRACAEAVGPFDERLGSYGEDVDFGLRAGDNGWKVLVVTGAHANGLGTSSPSAVQRSAANTVLLNAKRDGAVGAARAMTSLLTTVVRNSAGGLLPGRDPERRAGCRQFAKHRGKAAVELLTSGRLAGMLRARSLWTAQGVEAARFAGDPGAVPPAASARFRRPPRRGFHEDRRTEGGR